MIKGRKILLFGIVLIFIGCSSYYQTSNTKENLQQALMEKAKRAGIYLVASKQAENEGYSEVAVYLGELVEEEIKHIKKLSILQVKLKRNTKKNLKEIMKMEKKAFLSTYLRMARVAKNEGKEEIARIFEDLAKDEERHYMGIKGIYKRIED